MTTSCGKEKQTCYMECSARAVLFDLACDWLCSVQRACGEKTYSDNRESKLLSGLGDAEWAVHNCSLFSFTRALLQFLISPAIVSVVEFRLKIFLHFSCLR